MDVILIPGFWLTGDSWAPITDALSAEGHRVHPVTLPGLGPDDISETRARIGLADHVAAVVALVDELPDGVVLVGHSGGGAVAHAVVDAVVGARPHAVAHVVYVDSAPLADGGCINADLPAAQGEIPLPDWSVFDEESLRDMSPVIRAAFARVAIPTPAAVASDPQRLNDAARFTVPITLICCEMDVATMRGIAEDPEHPWHSYLAETARVQDVTWVDLPTGHWPQFTRPGDLAQTLLTALRELT
ncbi:alpha/beta fold hydrolase [Serinibacter salmoneus]|uniref:Pimeloyl-ACP methyl ester carboxylesterase n=1 Tax=Serinibacter salmoneus TaxID=556530 RepID=A0A2A9CZ10_9MICO|nr:alpha/beta hydrolase [Serinibacter salmoneus]PFG19677.1 pimeloyl-ACP methyl ester carboxylesterase [Serinibacter salmoneus]